VVSRYPNLYAVSDEILDLRQNSAFLDQQLEARWDALEPFKWP